MATSQESEGQGSEKAYARQDPSRGLCCAQSSWFKIEDRAERYHRNGSDHQQCQDQNNQLRHRA